MQSNNIQILYFSIFIIVISFVSVLLFTLPALTDFLELSSDSTSNIGSTIGGLTAPIIGIISSILLYLTLTKQTESNRNQNLKNESDLIFLLLNQLDNEILNFYFTTNQIKGEQTIEFKYTGLEAFHNFVQEINKRKFNNFNHSLYSFYQTKQLLLVLRSYALIENRIESSDLSEIIKNVFLEKLNSIYECKLKESLNILIQAINDCSKLKDQSFEEIVNFTNKNNKKYYS